MNADELLPGSRLIVRRRAYFHHGIYVGNGRVIHYAGWFRSARGLVEEVTPEQFTEGRPYRNRADAYGSLLRRGDRAACAFEVR